MQGEIDLLSQALGYRYRVERELGSGASARVYLCEDLKYRRQVALKLLRSELAGTVAPDRFLLEIDLAAKLSHPHILPLLDSGEVGGRVYFVMPFVEGGSLRERLRAEGALPVDVALQLARDVGGALHHAHEHGVVHRDVKPSNILLADGVAMLADFGIARAGTTSTQSGLTATGTALGTPLYMSPEQLSGDARVDARTDIYSLGCVIYETLAGEPPFTGSDPRVIAARHLTQSPAPLSSLRPVPVSVEVAIERALAKTPVDRFATVADFLSLLQSDATDAIKNATRRRRVGRRPAWWLVPSAAVLIVAAVVPWIFNAVTGSSLDPNRIGVFPVIDRDQLDGDPVGAEQVATYLGYLLEGTDPLVWEEGRDWLNADERASPASLSTERKLEASRSRGVGRLLDGDVLRGPDSLRVIMRLYDVNDGSLLARRGATGPSHASEAVLAAEAVTLLLADLLGDRPLEVETLSGGNPAAVAQFHLGEVAFRDMRISDALDHYNNSVRADSLFALAAVKGALAANWLHREDHAQELVRLAVESQDNLPPRFVRMARGLVHYFEGEADSAVFQMRAGLSLAPEWAEGWMALGDVYFEQMPQVGPLDSLAKAAYRDAVRFDPAFKVPLVPLADYALWEGDPQRSRQLLDEIERGNPDLLQLHSARLLADCVEYGPGSIDWVDEIAREPSLVLSVALSASIGGVSTACTEVAARTLLGTASATNEAWAAFLLLQSVLAVQSRFDELDALMSSPTVANLPTGMVYLFDAAAGHPVTVGAVRAAEELWVGVDTASATRLWALGEYEAQRGDSERLARVLLELEERNVDAPSATTSFFVDVLAAQLAYLQRGGDAIDALKTLRPHGGLMWDMWGAIVLERARLAEALLAEGRWSEAERVATELESHRSAFHFLLLPRSLSVRVQAAEQLGRTKQAGELRERLRLLRTGTPR